MKKKLLSLLSLLTLSGLALALLGCHSVGELVMLSPGVEDSIKYSDLSETRLPDGRLQVNARLRNRENRRIQVQVDCQFKDENGAMIDATPFENVILNENSDEYLKFVSMSDKAQRYLIRVREAH